MQAFQITAKDRVTGKTKSFGFFTPQRYADGVCQDLEASESVWFHGFEVGEPVDVIGKIVWESTRAA